MRDVDYQKCGTCLAASAHRAEKCSACLAFHSLNWTRHYIVFDWLVLSMPATHVALLDYGIGQLCPGVLNVTSLSRSN